MKNAYKKPETHYISHIGVLSNDEIVSLPDVEIQEYFTVNNYKKNTRLYKTNSSFLLREIGDESVLVPIGDVGALSNSVISLNETCQFLWKQFQTPSTIQDVIIKTKEEYSDSMNRIEDEIYEFVNAYLQVGLLQKE